MSFSNVFSLLLFFVIILSYFLFIVYFVTLNWLELWLVHLVHAFHLLSTINGLYYIYMGVCVCVCVFSDLVLQWNNKCLITLLQVNKRPALKMGL